MKMDGVASPFEHDRLHIVIQNSARNTAPILEGVDVGEQQILDALVEKEFDPQGARIGKREDEAGQTARGAANADLPEVRPISLCLFARQSRETKEGFAFVRAQARHHAAQLNGRAGIPSLFDHLEQAGRAQRGIFLERAANEVQIGISQTSAQGRAAAEAMRLDCASDGVRMKAELSGDRADLPVLGEEQSADVGNLFGRDHCSLQVRKRIDEPSQPPAKTAGQSQPSGLKQTLRGARETQTGAGRGLPGVSDQVASHSVISERSLRTLIRHARGGEAPAIRPLPVAMIKAAFVGLLMAEIGGAALNTASRPATRGATVDLAAITM